MATVTEVNLTCDVCGDTNDIKTRTFGLDGQAYEIDLCRRDGDALGRVAARYMARARKVTAKRRRGPRGGGPRAKATTSRSTTAASAAGVPRQKGIYVYGILPADIEVAAGIPGVGEHPGLLRDVRCDGLAALISEVDSSGRLGSPDDLRTYREILDATAAEVPVLPLRFGTIMASEDAVAKDLLAARHGEFTAALDRLEGRTEFQVKGRYVKDAVLGEVESQNKQAAVKARREEDTRTLMQAMEGLCLASVAREPARELDAVHVAFLVAVDQEPEVERAIDDLAHEWEGRIDVQLLGPMAAYDFAGAAQPES
ncbi:MAG TPA: GvpL/GvpF family gas vesicle protein [Streptosporangiaceae bacterium]|nr:GvpL/GvpF family gas vesicle protein [Streptosporangiaceae bacterium]